MAPTRKARRLTTHHVKAGRLPASLPRLIRTEKMTPSATAMIIPTTPTIAISNVDCRSGRPCSRGSNFLTTQPIRRMMPVKERVMATRRPIACQSIGSAGPFCGVSRTNMVSTTANSMTTLIKMSAPQILPALTILLTVKATMMRGRGNSKKALIAE